MSAEDLTTQCDCYAYAEQSGQHAMACGLWENDLFVRGHADWDPNLETLVLVHPIFQSLHEMSDEEVAIETGGLTIVEELDPVEEARMDFEDRCLTCEEELWETIQDGTMEFPPFNYTIDGISRVFDEKDCVWENAKLGCHCEPSEATVCNRCGVWREKHKGEGTYWEQQWKASIVRQTDICCRCAQQFNTSWSCSTCEVKRVPSENGSDPYTQPMMKWTEEMKRKSKGQTPKGGVTAWSGFEKGVGAKTKKVTPYVTCRHKGRELKFPNGKVIFGSSCHAKAPDGYVPDFGFYLDSCWFSEAQQLGIMVPWQDMGLPKIEREHVDAAVTLACTMIDRGDVIEVGCIGGHGRTGTFLAIIALRNGVDTPLEAIEYVRKNYCEKAIESATQEWYVEAWHAIENDLPVPEKPQPQSYKTGASTYQKNGNISRAKKCDMKTWYCPECNADVDDDAATCYWCAVKFTNPGLLPLEDWTGMNVTPAGVAKAEKRILEPEKIPEAELRKPPVVKAVTTGTTATQSSLPFGTPEGDVEEVLESMMLGGWGGPF